MNYSKIDICSMALLKIGVQPISSFNQNTAQAKICSTFYESVKQRVLSSHPWTFACTNLNLSKLDQKGIPQYNYCYLLPKNILRVLSCNSNSSYKIMKDKLYSNDDQAILKVIEDISEQDMPPFFINLLIDNLAYEFCLPLTEDTAKAKYFKDICQTQERIAKLIDSQQKTPSKFTRFPLTDCRG